MEIALGCRTLARPGGGNARIALGGAGHRPAHRLWILSRQIAGHGKEAILAGAIHDRQLTAFKFIAAVREDLVHHLDHRIAAREQDALLAIAREAHILPVQREGGGHGGRLLAGAFHVEAGLALPLRAEHTLVERSGQRHGA